MKLKITLTTFLFIALISCKSQQFTLDNLPDKQLVFGKGGGVTGAVDTYVLLENGQLFHTNSLTKIEEELKKVSDDYTEEFFGKLEGLQLNNVDFNHPGNVYYFIEDVNADERAKVVWGSFEHGVNPVYKELYDNLINQLK
ncbi:hypothetical protein [Maribacter hydrothermalis]|uniref:Uncharacterized protein n=1 Tax=Maribacter hydrothermalis TaxID=1836467 RepID=A0A1B7ZF27_9FLAO|nr:hypothetical protein [Maribacter hydrothermalis]APQ17692.1 hypothetical protein BTR34_10285 [Maribacter hydrothermalis]OBR42167.1 hypothetical protein A9200_01910 [Maribacter hydrothermalis]